MPTNEEIAAHLCRLGWRLAVIETTAGGRIAAQLTSVAGASRWFEEGRIVYSHEAKARLGCDPQVFIDHGSVSMEAVKELALVAMARFDVNVVVAETGISGPGGGSPEKPVGTCWQGVAIKAPGKPATFTYTRREFQGTREHVQIMSARCALVMLNQALREE